MKQESGEKLEETISLNELVGILKKRVLLIFLAALAGLGGAAVLTFFFIRPMYSSSAELIVQAQSTNDTTIVQLINTYKDMIMGDVVLKDVTKELNETYNDEVTQKALVKRIAVEQSQNSQMFQIRATADTPQKAAKIANVTARIFKEKATDILAVNKVTITSQAQTMPDAVTPNNKLNMAIGALCGLLLGTMSAFLFELADKTVKDERFIIEALNLPILGTVNEMTSKELSQGRAVQFGQPIAEKTTNISGSRRSRKRV